ncbi:MAG: hypothetical protein ACE5E8_00840 [Acidimicrobiia bacterium]
MSLMQSVAERMEASLDRFFDPGHEVFSPPREVGDVTIVTASVWERAGGFGFGGGGDGDEGGGGAGGGGTSSGRPVAVIEIGKAGVFIRPELDYTRIGVTLLVGVFALWRAGRRR